MVKGYPSLLFPLAVSTFAYFWFEQLQRFLFRTVVNWAATYNSVLGFQTSAQDISNPAVRRALLMFLPFSLILRLLSFSIYVAAFIVTARTVRSIVLSGEPDWGSAVFFLRSRFFRVVLFTLAIFLLSAILISGSASLSGTSTFFEGIRNRIGTINAAKIVTLPVFVVTSWILIPFSYRLVVDGPRRAIPDSQKLFGRIAAIATIVIYILASYLILAATPSINMALQSEIWIRTYFVWPAISILGELPLSLLWIFLGLLFFEDFERPEIPSPS